MKQIILTAIIALIGITVGQAQQQQPIVGDTKLQSEVFVQPIWPYLSQLQRDSARHMTWYDYLKVDTVYAWNAVESGLAQFTMFLGTDSIAVVRLEDGTDAIYRENCKNRNLRPLMTPRGGFEKEPCLEIIFLVTELNFLYIDQRKFEYKAPPPLMIHQKRAIFSFGPYIENTNGNEWEFGAVATNWNNWTNQFPMGTSPDWKLVNLISSLRATLAIADPEKDCTTQECLDLLEKKKEARIQLEACTRLAIGAQRSMILPYLGFQFETSYGKSFGFKTKPQITAGLMFGGKRLMLNRGLQGFVQLAYGPDIYLGPHEGQAVDWRFNVNIGASYNFVTGRNKRFMFD